MQMTLETGMAVASFAVNCNIPVIVVQASSLLPHEMQAGSPHHNYAPPDSEIAHGY